jgi:phosphoserine phosphatase RsbX
VHEVFVDARVHGRPRQGEAFSGDAGVVRATPDGTWVMLVDGLGHGPLAAHAAGLAVEEFANFPAHLPVEDALKRVHERLLGSRGVAAALAWFDARGVTLAGVGNVEVRGLERRLPYIPDNGVLGGRIRRIRSTTIDLEPGERLLFHTDGVARRTPFDTLTSLEPTTLCSVLIDEHSHSYDDATVIHVTYLGGSSEPDPNLGPNLDPDPAP